MNQSTFQLSTEQRQICETVATPTIQKRSGGDIRTVQQGKLVRVTSAAGTGKTTTLLEIAKQAFCLGHEHIVYLTFNKSAAEDAKRRLQQALIKQQQQQQQQEHNNNYVQSSTIHSCAMRLLRNDEDDNVDNDDNDDPTRLYDDTRLMKFIEINCRMEIQEFLRPCYRKIMKDCRNNRTDTKMEQKQDDAKKQVIFFIFKTLVNFCRSKMTFEDLSNKNTFNRVYFPAKKYHRSKSAENNGFIVDEYKRRISFYADIIVEKLWNLLSKNSIISFDLEVKRAQLKQLKIDGSLILVDEAQDMDECQVSWMANQCNFGTHVYLVGDCAQSIYGFRGAKSKCLMELSKSFQIEDCTLTRSWRFGENIARIANGILFCKENSPQTNTKTPTWLPYRVIGASTMPCQVTSDRLLHTWKEKQVTLIAFTNATLLLEAIEVLGFKVPSDNNTESNDNSNEDEASAISDISSSTPNADTSITIEIPKIHLNGKGENSGARKWKSVIKRIEHLQRLYTSQPNSIELPAKEFPDFKGQSVSWRSFVKACEDRELNAYTTTISVVQKLQHKAVEAVRLFQSQVLDNKYSADEADVILTTCHAAKGMEWDNVQVCEDFLNLCKVQEDSIKELSSESQLMKKILSASSKKKEKRSKIWQMSCKSWGDDVNLLYVACTRAKRLLSIPTSLVNFFQECDTLHQYMQAKNKKIVKNSSSLVNKSENSSKTKSNTKINIFEMQLSSTDAEYLYSDIVIPLRKENSMVGEDLLSDSMISDYSTTISNDDTEKKSEMSHNDEFQDIESAQSTQSTDIDGCDSRKQQRGVKRRMLTDISPNSVLKNPCQQQLC